MDWQTPDSFLELVRQVGPIALDPCTSPENPVGAEFFCSPVTVQDDQGRPVVAPYSDGLQRRWADFTPWGLAFCNPPYGRSLGAWAAKITSEAQAGCEIIALVPSRTDTKWFHLMTDHMTSLLLWKGRLTFKGAPAPAPFPSAVFYFGKNWARFYEVFGPYGCDV